MMKKYMYECMPDGHCQGKLKLFSFPLSDYCTQGAFLSSLHVLCHHDHYTHFSDKDGELHKDEVMCKGHTGCKRQRHDLNWSPCSYRFIVLLSRGGRIFSHEHCSQQSFDSSCLHLD